MFRRAPSSNELSDGKIQCKAYARTAHMRICRAVTSAAFCPDGKTIVTASLDATARLWDAASQKEIAVLKGHEDFVISAAFRSI